MNDDDSVGIETCSNAQCHFYSTASD